VNNRHLEDRFYEQKEFISCAIKLRHIDYWTAIQHMRSLSLEMPLAHVRIYECQFCDGLHLTSGRSHKDYFGLVKSLSVLKERMGTEGYKKRAPRHIKARHVKLVTFVLPIKYQSSKARQVRLLESTSCKAYRPGSGKSIKYPSSKGRSPRKAINLPDSGPARP
jgi:hypothetical protein